MKVGRVPLAHISPQSSDEELLTIESRPLEKNPLKHRLHMSHKLLRKPETQEPGTALEQSPLIPTYNNSENKNEIEIDEQANQTSFLSLPKIK